MTGGVGWRQRGGRIRHLCCSIFCRRLASGFRFGSFGDRMRGSAERSFVGSAGVAQSVEQLIRNEKVGCSIHLSGTKSVKETPLSKR